MVHGAIYLSGIEYNVLAHQVCKRKRVSAFIIDETVILFEQKYYFLYLATESISKTIMGFHVSERKNMLVVRQFIELLISKYGCHLVYSDGDAWYPEACNALGLKHHLHSHYEKRVIE